MRMLLRLLAAVAVIYAIVFGVVLAAMSQTPDRFGAFMRYAPAPIVWGALPAKQMWLWARDGALRVGDAAPDFSLPLLRSKQEIALSSFRGKKPVVLIFGSYT